MMHCTVEKATNIYTILERTLCALIENEGLESGIRTFVVAMHVLTGDALLAGLIASAELHRRGCSGAELKKLLSALGVSLEDEEPVATPEVAP